MGEVCAREIAGVIWSSCGSSKRRSIRAAGVMSQAVTKVKSQTAAMRVSMNAQMVNHPPSTYSSTISTDIPLYESPSASFDQYLEDKPRVFRAMFPDKQRSQRLNEEEWRVHMLPIEFMFMTVFPVIDMRLRCKTSGKEYPPGISPAISKVLELDIVRWELQGLDDAAKPTQFSLGVKGALYPDRRGLRTRLKGQLEMTISVILPPMLTLVPEYMLRSVSETVLTRLVENMKDKVNSNLLADYSKFRREQQMKLV
ncbi:hypothetical protein RND81_03G081700 [Saponaria officinalis]|uniref:DUF1997 family protein n=1 Tax=Saponaria officinalis TaxID=3572 RepID=A0AAW1M8T2_SAPOF